MIGRGEIFRRRGCTENTIGEENKMHNEGIVQKQDSEILRQIARTRGKAQAPCAMTLWTPSLSVKMETSGTASLKITLEVDNESALPRLLEGRVSEHVSIQHGTDALGSSYQNKAIAHLFLLILFRPPCFIHFQDIAIIGHPFFDNDGIAES